MSLRVIELEDADANVGYRPYGGCAQLFLTKDAEVVLSGPAETGKSLACMKKLNLLAIKYPRSRFLMLRKTYSALKDSAVVTFDNKVLGAYTHGTFDPDKTQVEKYGGSQPVYYRYPNGTVITLSGMDTGGGGSLSKVLSSEYDVIYVNQAEELAAEEWEILTTRCTGRAGNMPYAQIMGDCNPSHPQHWILKRAERAHLTLIHTTHRDNPTLFDPVTGTITQQGRRTMRQLDRLTGTRRLRLRDGLWVSAEGAIYPEYNPSYHVISQQQFYQLYGKNRMPGEWPKYRVVDFGYVAPFVCQWYALDPDGRAFMYREIYHTRRLVSEHAQQILQYSAKDRSLVATICDHDASARATLNDMGIETLPAYKDVLRGIEAVKQRFAVQEDGRARIFFLADALVERDEDLVLARAPSSTVEEIPAYIWRDHATREEPVKENDHGCDALRYFVAHVDKLRGKFAPTARHGVSALYGGRRY